MSVITNQDLLDAMNAFSGAVDQRLGTMDQRFDAVDQRFESLEARLTRVETQMVTKDYLDEKLWDLRGDMVRMMDRRVQKHESQLHTV